MVKYAFCTDIELASFLREGDKAAFSEIYHRYWEGLHRSAFAVLKDSSACDDLLQEIFVWLWLNREKHHVSSFEPYLRAAVKYKVANIIRHGKIRATYYLHSLSSFEQSFVETENVETKELKEIITKFSNSLPEKARKIFRMSRFEYLSNKEIAEQLGISEKTVENQMNINLKKLRVSLRKMSFWSILL